HLGDLSTIEVLEFSLTIITELFARNEDTARCRRSAAYLRFSGIIANIFCFQRLSVPMTPDTTLYMIEERATVEAAKAAFDGEFEKFDDQSTLNGVDA